MRRGGRFDLQGRELTVTGGALTYAGSWNGDLSLKGETVVPNVEFNDRSVRDVRVQASLLGSIDQPSLELSSDPALSRQEIVSAIATGRLQSSLVDSSAWLLGGQAATLVSGQLTRRVAQTFGLDEITVRPDLVARDTDPSARFTFGKRIGRPLALVYSAGLGGPETRFAEMRVSPGLNVHLRAQRSDDGTHELGLGQRFEFGGPPPDEPSEASGPRLQEVRFEGAPLDEELRRSVRLSTGKRVPDWRVQQEAERLRARLRRRGNLDAEVAARLEGGAAVFMVEPGPVYGWRVEGMDDPPSLERSFAGALFEADAADLGRARLLQALDERGYLAAVVEAVTREEGERREIVFTVEPGPRSDPVVVRFPGASALSRDVLLEAVGGASGLVQRPEAALDGLREAYRARHFLGDAYRAARGRETRAARSTLTVAIEEGPPARLAVDSRGRRRPSSTPSCTTSCRPPGPASRSRRPWSRRPWPGSAACTSRAATRTSGSGPSSSPKGATWDCSCGCARVSAASSRASPSPGTPGRGAGSSRGPSPSRRGSPWIRGVSGRPSGASSSSGPSPAPPSCPTRRTRGRSRVEVQEAAHLSAAYDARWDDEAGWSGLVDGLAGNLFGLGVGLGGRVRYGANLRELRGSLHLPAALAAGDVTGSVFRTEEDIPADDFEIVRRQTGFQIQHSLGRPSRLQALLGYRFRRNLTIAPSLPEIPIDVGGLDVSLLRTTQDDLLDPRRGAFWSLNLDVAPSWLGSDAPLVKGYAQAVLNRSFRDDTFTWAQSYRLGLSWGLGGEPVIASERFRAGGASSLRGFATNEVGPRGFFGEPTGGEAVAIMNQELRYHHRSGLGLVGFYDLGNVFDDRRVPALRFPSHSRRRPALGLAGRAPADRRGLPPRSSAGGEGLPAVLRPGAGLLTRAASKGAPPGPPRALPGRARMVAMGTVEPPRTPLSHGCHPVDGRLHSP